MVAMAKGKTKAEAEASLKTEALLAEKAIMKITVNTIVKIVIMVRNDKFTLSFIQSESVNVMVNLYFIISAMV